MFVATFVRHGETKLNAARIVQSRTHGELSERGVKMAESLGRYMSNEKWTRVFTSDLQRCRETTDSILKHSTHSTLPPIQLDPTLRERDYGDLEFQPGDKIREICESTGLPVHAIPLPGGEPYEVTKSRTATFFNMLCELADGSNGEGENVLVVTHGAWIMCLIDMLWEGQNKSNHLLEEWDSDWLKASPINTCTTRLTIHPKNNKEQGDGQGTENGQLRKIRFHHAMDTTHLPPGL